MSPFETIKLKIAQFDRELAGQISEKLLHDSCPRGMFGAHHMKESTLEYQVKRIGPLDISVRDVAPYLDALRRNETIRVRFDRVEMDAYVVEVFTTPGLYSRVVLRPTGAPHRIEHLGKGADFIIVDDPHAPTRWAAQWMLPGGSPEPHANCRWLDSRAAAVQKLATPIVKEDPMKEVKSRKFYVGSQHAHRNGWAKSSLAEAIAHAKELVEKTGEDQFIVKVIRIVRRKPQPIVVEDVK